MSTYEVVVGVLVDVEAVVVWVVAVDGTACAVVVLTCTSVDDGYRVVTEVVLLVGVDGVVCVVVLLVYVVVDGVLRLVVAGVVSTTVVDGIVSVAVKLTYGVVGVVEVTGYCQVTGIIGGIVLHSHGDGVVEGTCAVVNFLYCVVVAWLNGVVVMGGNHTVDGSVVGGVVNVGSV